MKQVQKFIQQFNLLKQYKSQQKTKSIFYTPKNAFSSYHELTVTSDYVFQRVFFDDKERIKSFLRSILVGENKIFPQDTKIEDAYYLPEGFFFNRAYEASRKILFDIQLKTTLGVFLIEIQKKSYADLIKSKEVYCTTEYAYQQIKDNRNMKASLQALPMITIAIVEDKLFDDEVPCVSYHVNSERKTKKQYINALSYVFIELEKYGDSKYDQTGITEDHEKEWLYLLKTSDIDHRYKDEQVKSAANRIRKLRKFNYLEYIKSEISEQAEEKERQFEREEGKLEGRAEGKAEGIVEGRAEGIAQGRAEGIAEGILIGKAQMGSK